MKNRRGRAIRIIGFFLVTALLATAFLHAAVEWRVYVHMAQAQKYRASGNSELYVRELIAAAGWVSPLSQSAESAAQAAYNGIVAWPDSDQATRQELLWLLRRSIVSSRSFLSQSSAGTDTGYFADTRPILLEKIDTALAVSSDEGLPTLIGGEEPQHSAQVVSQVLFLAWILCLVMAIFRGFTRELRICWRPLAGWLVASQAAFIGWLYALSRV